MDAKAKIAPANSEYSQRLNKIAAALGDNINGQPVNYKVYETKDVNAFAMANGCIRVYSGLMDLMRSPWVPTPCVRRRPPRAVSSVACRSLSWAIWAKNW